MAQQSGLPTSEELSGRWNEMKGLIREKWGQLTENELDQWKGKGDQLVGFIERKTGAGREQIEEFLRDAYSQGAGMLEAARRTASEYGSQASEKIQEGYQQVSDVVAQSYHGAEDVVRRRPSESIAVAFGAGLLIGVVFALTLRSR
jgi:uncharacterized protein YjbJ (UPF0337 family)